MNEENIPQYSWKVTITEKDLRAMLSFRRLINETGLEHIQYQRLDGTIMEFPKDLIDDWTLTGLNNTDFFRCEFWNATKKQRKGKEELPEFFDQYEQQT